MSEVLLRDVIARSVEIVLRECLSASSSFEDHFCFSFESALDARTFLCKYRNALSVKNITTIANRPCIYRMYSTEIPVHTLG